MNGGAIRATLISFLLSNISKMPNPTLVTRKTYRTLCPIFGAFCVRENFNTCLKLSFCRERL